MPSRVNVTEPSANATAGWSFVSSGGLPVRVVSLGGESPAVDRHYLAQLRMYAGAVKALREVLAEYLPVTVEHERYHQTIKRDVKQVPYEMPSDLEAAIDAFVAYYNYRRYHKALSNVTPSDMLKGRREQILQRRKEVHVATIERRRRYNRTLRELTRASS